MPFAEGRHLRKMRDAQDLADGGYGFQTFSHGLGDATAVQALVPDVPMLVVDVPRVRVQACAPPTLTPFS
jgi:hypothetical protein